MVEAVGFCLEEILGISSFVETPLHSFGSASSFCFLRVNFFVFSSF